MQTAICSQALIPVRSEASERSELVTQILFGEPFVVLQAMDNWTQIRLLTDGYEGWLDSKTVNTFCQESEDFRLWPKIKSLMAQGVDSTTNTSILLPFGSLLPNFDPIGITTTIGNKTYQLNEDDILLSHEIDLSSIVDYALNYVPAPYLWGGKSLMGIDCSGFSQLLYRMCNYWLPRDASQQVDHGDTVEFVQEAKAGDLAYFDNKEGKIIHVGLISAPGEIIHASGKVRIDKLDSQGIFNNELNKYTHQLRLIKRLSAE